MVSRFELMQITIRFPDCLALKNCLYWDLYLLSDVYFPQAFVPFAVLFTGDLSISGGGIKAYVPQVLLK